MNDEVINLADLPEDLRNQVIESRRKATEKKGLSYIAPRMYEAHFQTKEQQEIGQKLSEIIDQWNLLMDEWLGDKKKVREIK